MSQPVQRAEPIPSIVDRLLGPVLHAPGHATARRSRKVGRRRRIESMVNAQATGRAGDKRRQGAALEWVIASVKEDLRCLLNERQRIEGLPATDALSCSLLTFGLGDFSDLSATELRRGGFLKESIREAIARFEPRLRDVEVIIDQGGESDYEIRLSVRAVLDLVADSRLVSFDTVMRLSTGEVVVSGDGDGTEDRRLLPG